MTSKEKVQINKSNIHPVFQQVNCVPYSNISGKINLNQKIDFLTLNTRTNTSIIDLVKSVNLFASSTCAAQIFRDVNPIL